MPHYTSWIGRARSVNRAVAGIHKPDAPLVFRLVVERANVDGAFVDRSRADDVEEMFAVRKKLWPVVEALGLCVHDCEGLRCATRGGDAAQTIISCPLGKHDDTLGIPRPA